MVLGPYHEVERHYFESCDRGEVDHERVFSEVIPGCDAVICFGILDSQGADKLANYGKFKSLVDISRSFNVRRLICVPCFGVLEENKIAGHSGDHTDDLWKQSSEAISQFEEYLQEVASDNFTALTVWSDPTIGYSPQKKLELIISVIQNRITKTRRVTLFGGKKERISTGLRETIGNFVSDYPDGWYPGLNSHISHVAIESLHDLCMYLLGDSIEEICTNFWPYLVSGQVYLNRFHALRDKIAVKERPLFPIVLNLRGRIFRAHWVIRRLFDVFMMMVLLHLWPEQMYRFSTRKLLPSKNNRYSKESRQVIPYDLMKSKSSKIQEMEEINVIGRGASFDLTQLESINGPKFLVSFWAPVKTDDNDVTYVICRKRAVDLLTRMGLNVISTEVYRTDKDEKLYPMSKDWGTPSFLALFDNDHCKRISIAEKVYRPPLLAPYLHWAPTGSFLPAVCALSLVADRINIYGWDFYLESSPDKMSYLKLLFNMFKYKLDMRSRNHFESALLNFYYGYQLSKAPNIHMYGYLAELGRHEKLISRIERVLFNP